MHSFTLLLCVTSLLCAASAGVLVARDPRRRAAWVISLLLLGTAYWGLCQMVAIGTADPTRAVGWLRASAPGWLLPAFALLGGISVWTLYRYGYSLIAVGGFGDEILAALPDGVALLHASGRIRKANAGLARLTGLTPEQLEGAHVGDLIEPALVDGTQGLQDVEARLRAGDETIPVSVSTSLLIDRRGNALGMILVTRDLRELTQLRTQLVTAGRLAAIGELAAGIVHEINNPIAYVRSNLCQLQGHWKQLRSELAETPTLDRARELASDGDALIEESIEGVDRTASIVRAVRNFSHSGTGRREPTDLNALLDDVLQMVGVKLRGKVALECSYAELPRVECAPQEMKQVFLNLLLNAEQAIEARGTIQVRTTLAGGIATVAIEDDGCGIEPDVISRIFEPFFTTKPVGEGTGLGLGIAQHIVSHHGGHIDVESRPGVGTRVRVRLPASGLDGVDA